MTTTNVDFSDIKRVPTDTGGTTVVPRMNPNWDELTKLRWNAAVATLDSGLTITVNPSVTEATSPDRGIFPSRTRQIPDYTVTVSNASISTGFDFLGATRYLHGVVTGAQMMKRRIES